MATTTVNLNIVSQEITNGVTDKSPSEDVVFDALDGKLNNTTDTFTGELTLSGTLKQAYTETRNTLTRPVLNEEYFLLSPSNPVASATDFHGIDCRYVTAGANINSNTSIYNIESDISHDTTGTMGRAVGIYSLVDNGSTGTITESSNLQLWTRNQSTGVITTSKGIEVYDPQNSGGGTITNHYSIYLRNVTTPSGAKYGLYSLANNYMRSLEVGDGSSNSIVMSVNTTSATEGIYVTGNATRGIYSVGSMSFAIRGTSTKSGGYGVYGTTSGTTGNCYGVYGLSSGAGTGINTAVFGVAQNAVTNTALRGQAISAGASINTGLYLEASGGTLNYAIRIESGDIRLPSGALGFTGTGSYTNFTIEKGIITNAS